MTYSSNLADKVESILKEVDLPEFQRQEMFGSLAFTVNGNVAIGVYKQQLLVLISPDSLETVLQNPNTTEFDVTRSFMKDWILVDEPGFKKEDDLRKWIKKGFKSALLLPQK